MDARGLGFDALRAARPDLVYVAISPFGQTGPYAHHLATDLTLAAMGGAMALNGEPDRRPVRITVPADVATTPPPRARSARWSPTSAGGAPARPSSSTSPCRRPCSGPGLNAMIAHAIQGRDIERNGTVLQLSTLTTPLVYPCADGEVVPHRHRRPRSSG